MVTRTQQISLRWAAIGGLAGLLMVGGCAQRSVSVATSVGGVAQAGAEVKAEPGAPMKGLEKAPREEIVKPMEVAKAEPRAGGPGKEREVVMWEALDVYFAYDRWSLSPEGRKNLDRNAETLKQTPSTRLLIEGHCDERGSREYNLVLGEKRAQETRRYLQALGVTNPMAVTSLGKERPVCAEPDESCYWKNRRAHLLVQDK